MIENQDLLEEKEEVKIPVIGEFKPKRKFLNFISGVNGAKVRFIRDIAFVKGEKLSGILEGVVFKITICDEGTINFEEVDTNKSDKGMRQRLIDDIDSNDVTGYTHKFIVANLEFNDVDGLRCYLEVEHEKPIDKLRDLITETEKISEKGMSFLDSLFGDDEDEEEEDDENTIVEEDVEDVEEVETTTKSHLEDTFRKMNEDKVIELKSRIEDSEKDIRKYNNEIKQTEARLKEVNSKLGVLQSRLESLSPYDELNGYVFFVSEEQKMETGIDDNTKSIADKIADLMGLKKDVLFDHLTSSFYKIKIAKKEDHNDFKVSSEVLDKISSIDVMGNFAHNKETNSFEYRGELNWHQLVGKFLRKGFEQDPTFDRESGSNSYVRVSDKSGEMNVGPVVLKNDEGFVDMGNGVYGVMPSEPTKIKSYQDFSNEDEGDEDDIQEALEEFEEATGYPMGDKYLFAFGVNPDNDPDEPFYIQITPKSYWDKEGATWDGHLDYILKLPKHFEELAEGTFVSRKRDTDCISDFMKRGDFTFDSKYQDFMEDFITNGSGKKYTINGITLEEFMDSNYPKL